MLLTAASSGFVLLAAAGGHCLPSAVGLGRFCLDGRNAHTCSGASSAFVSSVIRNSHVPRGCFAVSRGVVCFALSLNIECVGVVCAVWSLLVFTLPSPPGTRPAHASLWWQCCLKTFVIITSPRRRLSQGGALSLAGQGAHSPLPALEKSHVSPVAAAPPLPGTFSLGRLPLMAEASTPPAPQLRPVEVGGC